MAEFDAQLFLEDEVTRLRLMKLSKPQVIHLFDFIELDYSEQMTKRDLVDLLSLWLALTDDQTRALREEQTRVRELESQKRRDACRKKEQELERKIADAKLEIEALKHNQTVEAEAVVGVTVTRGAVVGKDASVTVETGPRFGDFGISVGDGMTTQSLSGTPMIKPLPSENSEVVIYECTRESPPANDVCLWDLSSLTLIGGPVSKEGAEVLTLDDQGVSRSEVLAIPGGSTHKERDVDLSDSFFVNLDNFQYALQHREEIDLVQKVEPMDKTFTSVEDTFTPSLVGVSVADEIFDSTGGTEHFGSGNLKVPGPIWSLLAEIRLAGEVWSVLSCDLPAGKTQMLHILDLGVTLPIEQPSYMSSPAKVIRGARKSLYFRWSCALDRSLFEMT